MTPAIGTPGDDVDSAERSAADSWPTPAAALTPPVSTAALSDRGEDRALRDAVRRFLAEYDSVFATPDGVEWTLNAMRRALTPQGGAR